MWRKWITAVVFCLWSVGVSAQTLLVNPKGLWFEISLDDGRIVMIQNVPTNMVTRYRFGFTTETTPPFVSPAVTFDLGHPTPPLNSQTLAFPDAQWYQPPVSGVYRKLVRAEGPTGNSEWAYSEAFALIVAPRPAGKPIMRRQ